MNADCKSSKRLKGNLLIDMLQLTIEGIYVCYLSLVVVLWLHYITAIVGFTSLTEEEKDEATNAGIKPYTWNQFVQKVGVCYFRNLLSFNLWND